MNLLKMIWHKIHLSKDHVRSGNYEGDDRRLYQHFFTGPDRRSLRAESKAFNK